MEMFSNLKNNTYYYGNGYYFDIIHDFDAHCYDAWLYSGRKQDRMYLGTADDDLDQTKLIRNVKARVASALTAYEAMVS